MAMYNSLRHNTLTSSSGLRWPIWWTVSLPKDVHKCSGDGDGSQAVLYGGKLKGSNFKCKKPSIYTPPHVMPRTFLCIVESKETF